MLMNSGDPFRDPSHASVEPHIRLSAVVPCFNEQEVLPELERRLRLACEVAVGSNKYEIILVNDGSYYATGELMAIMSRRNENIIAIELSRNFGHQTALTAGLTFARGQRIFVLDADLQDPPELLPQMWKLMDAGANVVYGRRIERRGESWIKVHTAK